MKKEIGIMHFIVNIVKNLSHIFAQSRNWSLL